MVFFGHIARISSLMTKIVLNHPLHQRQNFPRSLSSISPLSGSRKNARNREKALTDSCKTTSSKSDLSWETFDFSHSPKWDSRFGGEEYHSTNNDVIHIPSSENSDLLKLHEREKQADEDMKAEFERRHRLWQHLDPLLIERATDVLIPFVQKKRRERIQSVLKARTRQTRFLFENPANPSNVWACLRTLDSFGIQYVDVVLQSGQYQGKAALSQKRGMRVAMGSAKWLTINNHVNTEAALQSIKQDGYHIITTDVNPKSKDIRNMDWDAPGKPICIVMGNEERGISQQVQDISDESFYLPMVGFAESFNLSAATAITCAHLSASSDGNSKGPLRPGDLSQREYDTLLLRGYLNSVNHKTTKALFKKEGLVFPPDLNLS
ncbi:SpoU rRNA methylase family protein [Nitzschia inconspicua]|uniref:SpoU rRNA methylase family protein n=1 Tax=Nitzschia inconspicua TaxID=303405 RepID=A0A9K3M5F7_9STRA|nr:SpoU rRNA methylase family protein [Nitzschia inconspicua]